LDEVEADGTFDAVCATGRGELPGAADFVDAPDPLGSSLVEAGAGVLLSPTATGAVGRRAVEVLMVFFVAVATLSFTSTCCGLRE
jgi:hypothetical protein